MRFAARHFPLAKLTLNIAQNAEKGFVKKRKQNIGLLIDVTSMDKEYHYKCDCGIEMLVMEPEIDTIDDDKSLFFLNLSIWLQGYNNKPSLHEKLRHCYRILKTGNNYSDQIILNFEQAEKLYRDLHDIFHHYKVENL